MKKKKKISKLSGEHSLLPGVLPRGKTLAVVANNYAKADIKDVCFSPILLDFFNLVHIFYPVLYFSHDIEAANEQFTYIRIVTLFFTDDDMVKIMKGSNPNEANAYK